MLLRTVANYKNDCSTKNNGITECCIFNQLPLYHVIINGTSDVMHDVLEGVGRYVIGEVINYFVYEKKCLTLNIKLPIKIF